MDDLTAFLNARLDEREHFAKIARLAQKHRDQMLREVAAWRALLELHEVHSEPTLWGDGDRRGQPTGGTSYWCDECDHDRDYGHIGSHQEGCATLRHLAAVYSDHPGYRQEWKP